MRCSPSGEVQDGRSQTDGQGLLLLLFLLPAQRSSPLPLQSIVHSTSTPIPTSPLSLSISKTTEDQRRLPPSVLPSTSTHLANLLPPPSVSHFSPSPCPGRTELTQGAYGSQGPEPAVPQDPSDHRAALKASENYPALM